MIESPAALIEPSPLHADQLDQITPIRKRKRDRQRRSIIHSPALWIGLIILMDDGSACQIVALHPEPLCVPVQPGQ